MDKATVFVVDDDPGVGDSIRSLSSDFHLECRIFPSAEAILEEYPAEPGCLVLELRLPGISGLDLLECRPAAPVRHPAVVLTSFGDVRSVVRATRSGAVGFIEKPFEPHVLLGQVVEAIELDRCAREEYGRREEIHRRIASLTPRERTVLDMIVSGKANKEIALILSRSQKTIEVHRTHVMKKMRAANAADLVRLIVQDGGTGHFALPGVSSTPNVGRGTQPTENPVLFGSQAQS